MYQLRIAYQRHRYLLNRAAILIAFGMTALVLTLPMQGTEAGISLVAALTK